MKSSTPQRLVALLRGINVGGHNRLPMAELRVLCEGLGWSGVVTYVQSGNVVFQARDRGAMLEAALEEAIRARFGHDIAVIVRSASQWADYAASNPFPEAAETEPNRVMLALAKAPLPDGALAALRERAADNERVEQAGEAIWIHFGAGAGRSRIAPSGALFERIFGSPATTRNWRSVVRLQAMLA